MQAGGGTDGGAQAIGGRYRPIAQLGAGSTGTVWRAQDLQLGREVALKILRGDVAGDPAFADAFARETRAAARLNHPGVVALLDAGTDPAGPWIAMELVDGGDLGTLVAQRGPLTPTATARIGGQVGDALAAAHALGIVHRDVKPANLLLAQRTGGVKLADLGIAHLAGLPADPAGMTAGSIHHLAPEQLRGEPATPAADVYALGVTLFELVTGRRAFAGDSAEAIARAKVAGQVPAPALVRPDIPADLDAAIRWMLAPDPFARPSAAEVAGVLNRIAAAPPPQPAPPQMAPPPQPPAAPPPVERYAAPSVAAGTVSGAAAPKKGGSPVAAIAGCGLLVVAAVIVFAIILFGFGGGTGPAPTAAPTAVPTASPTLAPTAVPPSLAPIVTPFPAPAYTGLRLRDVEQLAAQAGVVLNVEYQEALDEKPDVVLDQDPTAGTELFPGDTLYLVVSQKPASVVVPDLKFQKEDQAIDALLEAGLKIGEKGTAFSGQVPEGRVVKTDPAAGAEVAPGTKVRYFLSMGPKPTASPTPAPTAEAKDPVSDYQCMTLENARALIAADGFVNEDQDITTDPEGGAFEGSWIVASQDPLPGSLLKPGKRVRLLVVDPGSGACS